MRTASWKILLATVIPFLCALPAAAQGASQTEAAENVVEAPAEAVQPSDEVAAAAEATTETAALAESDHAPPLELVVNIPSGRLEVLRSGEVVTTFPVSVGAPKHATPVGEFEVSKAVWNPWWHPPKSFWARNKKPEPPGPNNPMGRVKLFYQPLYFLHGTTEEGKLGRPASHGCVRMANDDVVALAMLLHEHATPEIGRDEIERIAENRSKTKEIPFERPVPLRVIYELVEVRDAQVVVHPDVYGRGGNREQLAQRVVDALAAHGVATESVDREQVAAVVAEARTKGGSWPVEQLVSAAPSAGAVTAVGR